jgi:hypothetical protein
MSTPFHQHLFDFMPLLKQELVLHPAGVIRVRECNLVEQIRNSQANYGQEGHSRPSGIIDVPGRPDLQKIGRTGSIRDGTHQRYHPRCLKSHRGSRLVAAYIGLDQQRGDKAPETTCP